MAITVQRRHRRFRGGRICINNDPRTGRPSTVTKTAIYVYGKLEIIVTDRVYRWAVVSNRRILQNHPVPTNRDPEIRETPPRMLQHGVRVLRDHARSSHIPATSRRTSGEISDGNASNTHPYSSDLSAPRGIDLFPKLKESVSPI